jgi:hypothetical protein
MPLLLVQDIGCPNPGICGDRPKLEKVEPACKTAGAVEYG